MTLYRIRKHGKPVGSYIVEFERARLGKLRLATGEYTERAAAAYQGMLETLADRSDWATLEALRDGTLRIRDVYRAYQAGTLKALAGADQLQRVAALLPAWIASGRSKHTRRNRASYGRRLLALKVDATLADLPAMLALIRQRSAERPRTFNEMLMHSRALVKTLGERHALYETIADIKTLKYQTKKRNPWTRAEIRDRMDFLGEFRGRMLWELCLTGMRPNEFWRDCDDPNPPYRGAWEQHVKESWIAIHGTKTDAAERMVPLVEPLQGPSCSYNAFRQHLEKFPGGRAFPYLARHTFRHVLERCRDIPPSRQDIYMGHQLAGVRGDYLWHEVGPWVAADAEAMRQAWRDGRVVVTARRIG